MNSFHVRADEAEYLDQLGLISSDLFINLKELDVINNYLGGHTATIKGLKYFLKKKNRKYY